MTNQTLMLVSVVLCSLGGWYVVLTKYLELKAMSNNKSKDPEPTKIDPVSPDFHKLPDDVTISNNHVPGMGPPPHPNFPFTIPEDLIATMNRLRPGASAIKAAATPAPVAHAPHTTEAKRTICNWAAILHLSGLAIILGIPFLNILAPAILWLLKKEQHPFLAKQGREVINFQITLTLMQFLCLGAGAMFIWLMPQTAQGLFAWTKTIRIVFGTSMHLPYNIFTIVPFFWGCVVMIRGAVAAYSGRSYKYPYAQPFLFATEATASKQEAKPTASAPVLNNMNFS